MTPDSPYECILQEDGFGKMSKELYSEIVDGAIRFSNNRNDRRDYLIWKLQLLTPDEIVGFDMIVDRLKIARDFAKMRFMAYWDSRFRHWVTTYENEMHRCAKISSKDLSFLDQVADIGFVASIAFRNKTGKNLYSENTPPALQRTQA